MDNSEDPKRRIGIYATYLCDAVFTGRIKRFIRINFSICATFGRTNLSRIKRLFFIRLKLSDRVYIVGEYFEAVELFDWPIYSTSV